MQGQIEVLLNEKSAARPANLHGLKLLPVRDPAADAVDHIADGGRFVGNVYIAGIGDITL